MDRDKPTSSFVIPKRARLDVAQSAPVIPDGYRISKPTNDEREKINAQISKKTPASLESYWRVSINNISMVKNAKLESNFNAYKNKVNAKEEHFGYRFVSDPEDIDTIARDGIRVGCDSFGEIGDTSRGVLMYSSPAVANGGHVIFKNKRVTVMMFRTVRGKTLEVPLGSGEKTPSTRHNCHVPYASREWCMQQNIPQLRMEHMQGSVYHYEYLDSHEGVKMYPSQLLPHAIITYERSDKKSSSTHIYQGPITFHLCGNLDHVISIRKKKLRGHVHRLYHFLEFPAAFYVDLKPSKIYNAKTDLEKFHELRFIRNMKPGQFLNTETTIINGSGTEFQNTSVAAHFVMTVIKEDLPMLKVLRKRCNFLVMSHHPWTVYYIPSGSIASEFGFPFFADQIHVIVCRQSLHPLTRHNLFIGTDQRDGLYASLVYDYARNVRPDQREFKEDIFSDYPEPEPRPVPVVIPVCTSVHPSLLKPVGRGILKDKRRQPRKMNVAFRDPVDDRSPEEQAEGEVQAAQNTLSFEEQRKEEQRNKEATNLFKGAIENSRAGRIADQSSSMGARPTGPSAEDYGQRTGLAPFPPLPPFSGQPPVHVPPMFPIPPHLMGAPMGVPPPRYNLPPPPIFTPQPGIFPPIRPPPFNSNIPPPPRPGAVVTGVDDFSRPPPPPPTLLPAAPPVAPNLTRPSEKAEVKEDDDMDMDISMDEPEDPAVTEMKKSRESEEIEQEEAPMEVDEEKDKEEEQGEETNEILKMAFQQTSQTKKIMTATLNNLESPHQFLEILRSKGLQTSDDSSAASASSSSQLDVDMRTPPNLNFSLSKPTALVKPVGLFEDNTTGSSESSQDIDYRNRPSSSSQKIVVKDRDDRPKDRDDRVKRDVRILNGIPMPKHSSIEEEGRKRLEHQIQEKMRANSKNVDQAVMNHQAGMAQQTTTDANKNQKLLNKLLGFKITSEGLTKATKSPPSEKTKPEEPDQIRSPSPEAREAYVPKSFLNSQEAPVIPTDAKEGYTTIYGVTEDKTSQDAPAEKSSPKKQRDYDSVSSAPSDQKMQSNWNSLMAQKSDGKTKEDEKSKEGSSGSVVPSGEGMNRPPGIYMSRGPNVRGNGYGRGRGRGHLLPTPQHASYTYMPPSNGFQRGRGGHYNNRFPQSRQPNPNFQQYLNNLQPAIDSSATNYSIFIDPDLSTNNTQPSELNTLFTDFNKLNRSPTRVFITVFVHENIMNFMRDNKKEQRHFFFAFNNHMNNPQSRLIEVLQRHGCDGIGAPKATDMANCMSSVNFRKKGKEAIFLSNSCPSDSECGRAFASRRIKVMNVRLLRRYLEEQEHIDFDIL